jgi:hypothetical protein
VSILQYADDTIIFLKHDLEKALNMKLVLCTFEQLSVLKINFHKSEVYYFGRLKKLKMIIHNCSVVSWVLSLSSIWGSRFTFANKKMVNGSQ